MLSTSSIIKKINNTNYKGYVRDKVTNKFEDKDPRPVEAILESLKLKRIEKIKTEEPKETIAEKFPLESDDEELEDILNIPPLESDEEVKEGKGLKILTPNELLSRLPIFLVQIKAGSNSYKLENEIR